MGSDTVPLRDNLSDLLPLSSRKVLFVTHHYLHGNGGGVYASRSFINAIATLVPDMTLLCPVNGTDLPAEILPSVHQVHVPYAVPRWRKGLDLLLGRIHRYFGVLEKELSAHQYDTVVFDTCYPSFRMLGKVREAGCRVITIHHNCQYEYARDNTPFPIRPLMLFWLRICERQAVRGSDLNLVLTPEDRELLYGFYDPHRLAKIEVAGVHEYKPVPLPALNRVREPVFIITGNLGAMQSEDSLMRWFDRYYPILKEKIPAARLILAGHAPSSRLADRCRSLEVELIPSPAEMDPILARARYYICPTDLGGGIKLRIMDGLRHGLPVLTAAVSARGYAPFLGKTLFSYADPETFRESLDSILEADFDPHDVQRLYKELFSFETCVQKLSQWI